MATPNRRPKGTTVLVVDDEPGMRRACARMLGRGGFEVVLAGSGREAISLAEAHAEEVQLALVDVDMPEMTGPEVARELKSRWPRLKILFMSGYSSEEVGQAGALERSAPFLGKPFSAEVLEQKVREVLGGGAAGS